MTKPNGHYHHYYHGIKSGLGILTALLTLPFSAVLLAFPIGAAHTHFTTDNNPIMGGVEATVNTGSFFAKSGVVITDAIVHKGDYCWTHNWETAFGDGIFATNDTEKPASCD